jgi:hypothetical protein
VTVKFPGWVLTLYSPIITKVWSSQDESAMLKAYREYLEWWQIGWRIQKTPIPPSSRPPKPAGSI